MSDTQAHKPNAPEMVGREAGLVDGGDIDEPQAAAEPSSRPPGEQHESTGTAPGQGSSDVRERPDDDAAGDVDDPMRSLTDEVNELVREVDAVCGGADAPAAQDHLAEETEAGAIGDEEDSETEAEAPASDGRETTGEPADALVAEVQELETQDGAKAGEGQGPGAAREMNRAAEPELEIDPADFEDPAASRESADIGHRVRDDAVTSPKSVGDGRASEAAEQGDVTGSGEAAEVGSPDRGGPSSPGPALQAMDQALADDVSDLMQGGVEAVSAVLDEGSEKQAAAGQGQESAPAEEPEPQTAPEAAADGAGEQRLDDDRALKTVQETVSVETPPTPVGAPESPEEQLKSDEAPLSGSVPLPARPGGEPRAAGAGAGPTEAPAEPRVEPEPIAEPEPEPAEDAPAGKRSELAALRSSVLGRIGALLVPVLEHLNYPLRLVPPRYRPFVDWFALSLVFWVPIVWIIALLVIGR